MTPASARTLAGRFGLLAVVLAIGPLGAALSPSARCYADENSASLEKAADSAIEVFEVDRRGDPILLPLKFEKQGRTFPVLLDTGAANNLYDFRLIRYLGESVGRTPLKLPFGTYSAAVYELAAASLGTMPLPRQGRAITFPFDSMRKSLGREIHGCIGLEFLKSSIVEINFDEGKVRLLRTVPPNAGSRADIVFEQGAPWIRAKIGASSEAAFALDTGYFRGVVVEHSLFKKLKDEGAITPGEGIPPERWPAPPLPRLSLDEPFEIPIFIDASESGRVNQLKMVEFEHSNLKVQSANWNILGIDYLSRFTVTFDFSKGAVYFRKGADFDHIERDDLSGIGFSHSGEEWWAAAIARESPAAKAGVKYGDGIVEVDGVKVGQYSRRRVSELFEQDGKSVSVTIQRWDERLQNWDTRLQKTLDLKAPERP